MKNILITLLVIFSAGITSRNSTATTVYQWTDADGVVHFSDAAPPRDSTTDAREINFGSFESTSPTQDTLSIIEQANLMAEWNRQAMEQHLAREKMELEQQRLTHEIELDRQDTQVYEQDRPHYYVFPQAVNYRYRQQWNNRPDHRRYSGSHARKILPASRSNPRPDRDRVRTGVATKY